MNIIPQEKKTYGPVAAGTYEARIIEATEAGDGSYIQIKMEVANDDKSWVWDRLYNDNETKAKYICTAIGKEWNGTLTPEELEDKPVSIDVGVVNKDGEDRNRVTSYRPSQVPF